MSRISIMKVVLCFLLIIVNGCIPALSSQYLAESDHPYENDCDKKWTVSEPGASEIRLHFKDLQLAKSGTYDYYDQVHILDRYGNTVEIYGGPFGVNSQDFWTKWYKGDKLTVELATDDTRPCYGFIVDKKDFKLDENITSDSETAGPIETQVSSTSGIETDNKDSNNKSSNEDFINEESSNILTSIDLTSSANPSTFGHSVAFTAEVDTPSQATKKPSGTVTFMDETTPIGTVDLTSGQAIFNTSSLLVGSHSITAVYNGDNNFKSSTSSPVKLTIKEQHSSEEQPSTEQLPNSEERPSTEKSSTVKNIVFFVSENPLVSSIIASLFVALILERKKKAENEMKKVEEEMKKVP